MRVIRWTPRARADLAAIRAFINEDSPHYAAVVVSRLIRATERPVVFPESGRSVPELVNREDVNLVLAQSRAARGQNDVLYSDL